MFSIYTLTSVDHVTITLSLPRGVRLRVRVRDSISLVSKLRNRTDAKVTLVFIKVR